MLLIRFILTGIFCLRLPLFNKVAGEFFCGNMDKEWYVFRAHQCNICKIRDYFCHMGIEHFIPFSRAGADFPSGTGTEKECPLVLDYIFIRTSLDEFDYKSLPYALRLNYDTINRCPMVVPEKQMSDFMFLCDFSTSAIYLTNDNLKRGDKVRVLKGNFAGIEGELIRIKGHKRVVVRLEGLFSLAVETYIPKSYLEVINTVNE